MRVRDISLRTGRLLGIVDADASCATPGSGVLFLISGYGDVDALARIEACAARVIEERQFRLLRWFDVADRQALTGDEAVALIASQVDGLDLTAGSELVKLRGADWVLADTLAGFRKRGERTALIVDELVYFLRTMTAELPERDRADVALTTVKALA